MIEMTVQVPDALAARIQSFGSWFPTILELSLLDFQTRTKESVSGLIRFLEKNPSSEEVLKYHASEKTHDRLKQLLELNKEGLLCESDNLELDEMEQLEHLVVMLKAKVAKENNLKL